MRSNEKNNGAAFLFEIIQFADQISTFRSFEVLWRRKWQQQRHQLWGDFQQRLNREKVQSWLDQEKEMNATAAASPVGEAFFWWCLLFLVMQLISVRYYLLLKLLSRWDVCIFTTRNWKDLYWFIYIYSSCMFHSFGRILWPNHQTKWVESLVSVEVWESLWLLYWLTITGWWAIEKHTL